MKTFVSAVIAIYKLPMTGVSPLRSSRSVFFPFHSSRVIHSAKSFRCARMFFPIGKSTVLSDHKEARRVSLKNVKDMRNTCRRSAM